MDDTKQLLVRISAFEETAILALESSGLPPEAGSIAEVLKQNRKNLLDLWEILGQGDGNEKGNRD